MVHSYNHFSYEVLSITREVCKFQYVDIILIGQCYCLFSCSTSALIDQKMCAVHSAPPGKRKEIYKYEAPWTVYSMNWSIRPDKRFRLALGSFVEEYNNKVGLGSGFVVQLLLFFLIYKSKPR